ncbi:MAG TPA: metallophosphoesterase [Erysipelotrichaceae bacterium]|nr:metallophosphoesterase [Erysipelotrichaceae bacterium]
MKKKIILSIILLVTILITIWTIWGNLTVGVTRYAVVSDRIPEAFDDYKIAVISDLHNAEFGKENESIVEKVRKENPDIIVMTGDLVDSNKIDIDIAITLVKQLMEIAPCYYVTGNHEAWIGIQYQILEQRLLKEGVIILHDEVIELKKDNELIQLAGLDDPDFTSRDSYEHLHILDKKLKEMTLSEDYCILLSHRPETFEAYVSNNIDLVLSGHAHGGQFRLPFFGGLIAPGQGWFPKYTCGKYTESETTMIVSRGIGNSIIPIRFNNRPEILIVILISSQ